MDNSVDIRPSVPIDWLFAVREYGLEAANRLEDRRLELERTLGRPVDLETVIAAAGFDCECEPEGSL